MTGVDARALEVAFLDTAGVIVSVNTAWDEFCRANGGDPARANGGDPARAGVGESYLGVCVAAGDDPVAMKVADAVRSAIRGELPAPVRLLIPCFGAGGTGWFDMTVHSRFAADSQCLGACVSLSAVPAGLSDGDGVTENPMVPEVAVLDPQGAVDLTGRVADVAGERDRLTTLLTATRSLATHLDLSEVLKQLVSAARDVVGADYAALGVLDDDQWLGEFVQSGVNPELAARIGALPTGRGILGRLIEDPHPLRLANLSTHPALSGFPEHHPTMTSFLGAPIRIRGSVFGNLYLTNKRGAAEFTEQDEQILVSLAATAAVVIENARLYQDISWRNRWREAGIRITNAILGDPGSPDLLVVIAREARQLVDADDLSIGQSLPGEDSMTVRAADGSRGQAFVGSTRPVAGSILEVVRRSGPFLSADASTDDRIPRLRVSLPEVGPVVAVPITLSGDGIGVLTATRHRGRRPFGASEETVLTHFAGQASLALELGHAQAATEHVRVLEERQRIARDVHDNVLGRLLGTGMGLQALTRHVTEPETRQRFDALIDELDTAIGDLRSVIYHRPHASTADIQAAPSLTTRLIAVIDEAAGHLGFTPTTDTIDTAIDAVDDVDLAQHLVAVLREGLTNVARHADAHAVRVTITAGGTVELTVSDDGRGMPDHPHKTTDTGGHGVTNMVARAEAMNGTCTLTSNPTGGTTLRWTAPTVRA